RHTRLQGDWSSDVCSSDLPVIRELARAGIVVSVDTMRAQVAEAALEAGATLVNDVSGGLADPYMPRLVARARAPYVVMHWRGPKIGRASCRERVGVRGSGD